jgi:hypothetical protein
MGVGEDKMDLVITKIEEKTVNAKDVIDQTTYKMSLKDGVNITKVTIEQTGGFDGFHIGDVVQLKIKRTQKTLDEK